MRLSYGGLMLNWGNVLVRNQDPFLFSFITGCSGKLVRTLTNSVVLKYTTGQTLQQESNM